jgi:exonuclease III
LKMLATPYTARSFGSRAIDIWWVVEKRLEKQGIEVRVRSLSGYPSDHSPVMLTLSKSGA